MSSLRNAVQRRNHKERSQPQARAKWGHLEKRRDYLLRARDYKSKQTRLNTLTASASSRNPDEFYFSMHNAKTSKGIPISDRGNTALSTETVKLLKTQDAGYLRVKQSMERKAIERLEVEAALVAPQWEKGKKRKHTVFVESRQEATKFDPVKHFDTVPELVNRVENRLRKSQLASLDMGKQLPELNGTAGKERKTERLKARRKRTKERARTLRELAGRLKRTEELEKAERELHLQRERMGKGSGLGKPGRFSKERKK